LIQISDQITRILKTKHKCLERNAPLIIPVATTSWLPKFFLELLKIQQARKLKQSALIFKDIFPLHSFQIVYILHRQLSISGTCGRATFYFLMQIQFSLKRINKG